MFDKKDEEVTVKEPALADAVPQDNVQIPVNMPKWTVIAGVSTLITMLIPLIYHLITPKKEESEVLVSAEAMQEMQIMLDSLHRLREFDMMETVLNTYGKLGVVDGHTKTWDTFST